LSRAFSLGYHRNFWILDCREKFDLLDNFWEGNFLGQLANRVQDNFFLAYAREYAQPSKNKTSWKISGSN